MEKKKEKKNKNIPLEKRQQIIDGLRSYENGIPKSQKVVRYND